jgi:hypothetical protein
LKYSVELYGLALHARGSWNETVDDYERRTLSELRAGYLAFVQQCCPGMQRYLDPWYNLPNFKNLKLVLVGRNSTESIAYMFALAKSTEPDVFVTELDVKTSFKDPRWHGATSIKATNLRMSSTRRDSTRLIAMDEALEKLRILTSQGVLPMSEMVVRERTRADFIALLRKGFVASQAKGMTVLQLGEWAENQRGSGFLVGHSLGRSRRDIIGADELEESCMRLVEYGFDTIPVVDLGIRPHSLRELTTQLDPPVPAIQEWLQHFWAAVTVTYRLTIEHGYPGLRSGALLGRFPCRLVARLKTTAGGRSFGIPGRHSFGVIYWWEAVATWDEAVPMISIDESEPVTLGDTWKFLEELKKQASALGRTRIDAQLSTCTLASLEKTETPVCDFVCDLVNDDLDLFYKSINRAD